MRAAAEELPNNPAMTPVVRPTGQAGATAPGWLSGTDSNVRPAAGTGGNQSMVRPLTPRTHGAKDESSVVAKGIEKLKSFGKGGRPESSERAPGQLPPGVAAVAANANTAFRGTGTNGSPVYAGPPAYRWYGWGSVTPGANPYAPTGQHPPASANWFSITGATPGAFPVPVTHPDRLTPGTEPPVYVTAPNQRVVPNWNHDLNEHARPWVCAWSGPSRTHGAPDRAAADGPVGRAEADADTDHHSAPADRSSRYHSCAHCRAGNDRPGTADPTGRNGVAGKPTASRQPRRDIESHHPAGNPTPLPVSVTDEKGNWQPTNDSNSSNEWGPADGKSKSHAAPRPVNWQQPGADTKTQGHPVARGQIEVSRRTRRLH